MIIIGIAIFLIGLYLVVNHKKEGLYGYFLSNDNTALDILNERYARGEITTDEFTNIKNVLTEK